LRALTESILVMPARSKSGKVANSGQMSGSRKLVRATKKTPRVTLKATKDMKLLRETAEVLKIETPAHFPKGAVLNVRAFQPLPDGWRHAMKLTGPSYRSKGGALRHCFIGPGGLVKWHKKDLEKHLGVLIPEVGSRPRCLSPLVMTEFPADAIIRRTEKQDAAEYILKRCNSLAGRTVSDALLKVQYEYNGKMRYYGVSDLRYDIKGGRLVLETGVASPLPPKREEISLEKKGELQGAPMTPPSNTTRLPSKSPVKTRVPKRASQPKQSSSSPNAILQHIRQSIFIPLLSRAASGEKDEICLYTLIGVGSQIKMEKLMLNALPNVLRTAPAERGVFGYEVLKQFEAELSKHL